MLLLDIQALGFVQGQGLLWHELKLFGDPALELLGASDNAGIGSINLGSG